MTRDADFSAAVAALQDKGLRWAVLTDSESPGLQGFGPDAKAVTPDMFVRLGSVSKLFVGAVCARLMAEGCLALETPLQGRVAVPSSCTGIRLQQLLSHQTGLRDALEAPDFRRVINRDVSVPVPKSAVLNASLAQPRDPRCARYANTNAILAAELCETVGETSFAAILERIFGCDGPLLQGPLPDPHPAGYRWGRGPGRIEYGTVLHEATHYDPSWAGAGGSMMARLRDLPESLRVAFETLQAAPEMDARYHWFAEKRHDWLCHAGDVPGFSCWAGYHTGSKRMIAVSAGLSWVPDLGNPAETLGRICADLHEEDWV